MRRVRQRGWWTGVLGTLMVLTGCAYEAAVQRLPPAERTAFHAYRKVMRAGQVRHYLRQQTPAERATYLQAIGIVQRFQALDTQDREAVLGGYLRPGMRAEALRFLWGQPYATAGYPGHYEHWYYQGSTFALAQHGNDPHSGGTMVDVYLVNGQVAWWLESLPTMVPNDPNDGDWGR